MASHERIEIIRKLRKIIDSKATKLPLPDIDPNKVSGLSVITSTIFILAHKESTTIAFIILAATILLDWLDGLIAKKYKRCTEAGYIIDTAADRMSEGIILIPFFMPWFYLFAANNILAVYSLKKHKHVVFPLRHAFAIYYFIEYMI